jgi:uncharacterized protein
MSNKTNNIQNYYLAEMHLFKENDAYFAFLPKKLQLFEVDETTYNILVNTREQFGTQTPIDTPDEDLVEAGLMYQADHPEEDEMKTINELRMAKIKENNVPIPVTNAVLQIANDCNLNCIYCYGDGGSYGRQRELMTFETAKKAIDLMVANSEGTDELLVIFFGGEPLINFEVVKATFDYCQSLEKSINKKFRYSMTTNGTILTDEIYDFIKNNNISVMISVDGGKDLQNKHRCYCDGRGSFEDVCKNIERFKEARGGFLTARATVCSTDIRFKKIRDDLLALGFTNAVTSMVDTAEDSPLFIGGDYTEKVLEQYQILADDYIEQIMQGKKPQNNLFANALDILYFKKMKARACNAGNNGIAIGTDGNIYPCHRFMGMPEYIIGNIDTGIDENLRSNYREATIYNKEECKDCWARYMCCGGCSHTSAVHSGDIFHAPTCYCDIYKGLYQILLCTYWKLKAWDEDIFRKTLDKTDKNVHTLSE